MSERTYQLIVFDWDGTLMDSSKRIISSMRSAALACGLAVPDDDKIRHIIGLSLDRAMITLFGELESELLTCLIDAYRRHYLHIDTTPTPLFDGVATLLQSLHAQGYYLAVATGKSRRGLDRVLTETGLGHYFHALRGADQALSKPDPLMLEQILTELDIEPGSALMVGDTSFDLEMALNIGMDSVGVSYGVHCPTTLERYRPVAVIDDIRHLSHLLDGGVIIK